MASFLDECEVEGDVSADEEEEDSGSDLEGFIAEEDDDADDEPMLHARLDQETVDVEPCQKRRRIDDAGGDDDTGGAVKGEKQWQQKYAKYRLIYVRFSDAIQWPVPYSMDDSCMLLGISGADSLTKVASAYRKFCRILHPDKNRCDNANEQFQVLQQAYNNVTNNAGTTSAKPARRQQQSAKQKEKAVDSPVYEVKVELDLADIFVAKCHTVWAVLLRLEKGVVKTVQRSFTILVPAGIMDCGIITMIDGVGNYDSNMGKHGAIRFVAHVIKCPGVTRLAHNLEIERTVKLHQVLDPKFRLHLSYLGRNEQVRLPPDAWHGQRIEYPGKGLPLYSAVTAENQQQQSNTCGSLYVRLSVTRPNKCPASIIQVLSDKCTY
jgi:hypothetical protein